MWIYEKIGFSSTMSWILAKISTWSIITYELGYSGKIRPILTFMFFDVITQFRQVDKRGYAKIFWAHPQKMAAQLCRTVYCLLHKNSPVANLPWNFGWLNLWLNEVRRRRLTTFVEKEALIFLIITAIEFSRHYASIWKYLEKNFEFSRYIHR